MAADTRVSITIDTGNAEDAIRRLREELDRLGGSADDASDDIDNAGNSGKKLSKALDGMKTIGAAAGVAFGAIGFALKGSVDEAIKFESAMADVKKVVNFDSPQGLQNMRQDLLDLSTQIPITADGLAQIAAAAGQSGIAANEITKFTEAAAKMGTAFDISAQEAGQAMAEMRTAFKMSQTDVEALADKINYLGNTSPNSAAKIMKIVQTVGPLGELAGVSAAQIAAMGASVNSLAPEVVATGLKNMFLALTKGESATKSASDAFKKLGLDSVQVSKDMQTNSEATINRIIEALKKLPEAQRTATINDIFGAEALPVIAQMVTNTETLTKNLTAVGDATKYAGSMQQEYAARSATTENQLALFSNNLNVLKVNVGSALLPAINQLAQAVIPVVQSMATWAQQNPDLVTQIVAITGAVLGAITVLGGLALAFTAVSSGIAAISAIAGGVAAVIGAISLPVVAVVAAIAALVTAGVLLYQNWDTVKAKATEIWGSISTYIGNAVKSIADWFRSAGQEIQNEFSVISNGVKSAMSAISSTVSSVWNGLKSIVSSAMSAVSSTVSSAWNGIKNAVSSAVNAIKSVVSAGLGLLSSVFRTQFNVIKTVVSTVMNAIKALVQGDIQGVKNAFSSGFSAIIGIVKTAVSNIISAFGSLGSQLFTIGVQAVQGLANGIKSRISAVGTEARALASNIATSIKSALDIHSPSRVTHALGEHAGQGLANGLKAKQSEVAKAAQATADTVKSTIGDLLKQRFMIGNDDPLADLQWRLQNGDLSGANSADKQKILELAKANQELVVIDKERVALANQLKQAQDGVDSSIADLSRQIALFGNDNPLSAFLYDMQNTDKYVGATAEKLQMMASKIQQLETLKQTKASADAFSKLGTDLAQESPMAKLTAEYEQRLAVVAQYEQLHTDKVAEAEAMRKQIKDSYTQASNSLMLSQYEGLFSGVAGITKAAFGEQSKAYRAMFAVQKAFSIAQSVMAIQTSVAKAMAVGFPANIPLIGQAISQGAGILSTLRGVQSPAVGQAHDGIMSVPKSGTWNLEKGERVLPKHTAAAMDKQLAESSGVNINIINNTGAPVTQRTEPNGDISVIVGQELERQLPKHVNNPYSGFNQALKQNYKVERRV